MLIGFNAAGITLSVVPGSQTVNPGDAVSTDIVISGLAPGGAPSLSTFDVNLTFDPSVLAIDTTDSNLDMVIDSVTLDPTGQLDLFGLGINPVFAGLTAANTLNLFELSFDLPADLDSMQAGSFVLASIGFTASASGASALGISINALGDSFGLPLAADVQGGSVTVSGGAGPGPMPIAPPFWLLVTGLATLAAGRARNPR